MRPLVSGDLIGQIGGVRLGGVDVGWTGLGPAEGEIVAAGEARRQGSKPKLDGQILDPGWPVAGMAVEIRVEGDVPLSSMNVLPASERLSPKANSVV
jgi:hypothetical protein